MKILDAYIIKRLLLVFLFVLFAASSSIELIDFVNKMDAFVNPNLSKADIILYYLSYTPFLFNFIAPIVAFMTSSLVTISLAANSEIIAALSIGIRYRRLVFPYIGFALLLSILSFIFCGWIIPNSNKYRVIFEINYLNNRKAYNSMRDIHIKVDQDKYAYVQYYNAYERVGYNFTLESIEDKLKGKFYAYQITWIPQKRVWRAKDWNLRKIIDMKESFKEGDTIDLELNLEPSDFGGDIYLRELFNMQELNKFIENLKTKSSDSLYLFEVEKYTRYMYPFSMILLVLIGMLFASRKLRSGVIWQTVLSFVLAIIYIGLFLFASNRAESHGSNILLTIWTPNIIFSFLVLLIYRFMPK